MENNFSLQSKRNKLTFEALVAHFGGIKTSETASKKLAYYLVQNIKVESIMVWVNCGGEVESTLFGDFSL